MHKAGRRRKQGKSVPIEVEAAQPPFISKEDLGVCDGCFHHRCQGSYEKGGHGNVKVRCHAAELVIGEKMVLAKTKISSREQCEYATHMDLHQHKYFFA